MEKKIKIKFQNSDPSAVPTEATLVFDSLNELPSDPAEFVITSYSIHYTKLYEKMIPNQNLK